MSLPVSDRSRQFTESVIREMTRLCQQHGGVNLAQGFPDFPAPETIKQEACRRGARPTSISTRSPGAPSACGTGSSRRRGGLPGSRTTPNAKSSCAAAPRSAWPPRCWQSSIPATRSSCSSPSTRTTARTPSCPARPRDSCGCASPNGRSTPPSWPPRSIRAPSAIVVNTPNNPTGKVFNRAELESIAALCQKWDVVAITDEIYEHIVYDGAEHVSLATLEGMRERTVVDLGRVEDLQRDRLADRLVPRPGRAHEPRSARSTTSSRSVPRRRCRRPPHWPWSSPIPTTANSRRPTASGATTSSRHCRP